MGCFMDEYIPEDGEIRVEERLRKKYDSSLWNEGSQSILLRKDYKEDGRVYLIPYVPPSQDNVSYRLLCILKPSSDFPFLFTNDSDCIKHSDNIDEKKDD